MRQAVITKFLGPTNHRCARIKVTSQAGSTTYPWDYALDAESNHAKAAQSYVEKMDWGPWSEWRGGGLPAGNGCAFVDTDGQK